MAPTVIAAGEFPGEVNEHEFLQRLKDVFNLSFLRHTAFTGKPVKRVALCGGAGSFLLKRAIQSGAQVFISADFKYHEYFDVENKLLLIDVGHFESEQFTPEIFSEIILKKIPTFALHLSKVNTNPVNYF